MCEESNITGRQQFRLWMVGSLYSGLIGATFGGLTGLAESGLAAIFGFFTVTPASIFTVAVFYTIAWGVAGLAVGLVVGGIALLSRKLQSLTTLAPVLSALVVSLIVFVTVGELANLFFLPRVLSTPSLLFDGALLVACLMLGRTIFRLIKRRAESGRVARFIRSPLARALAALVVLTAVAAVVPSGRPEEQGAVRTRTATGPNVLLLVADAMRPDHLGCYGYERDTSPNIDSLAGEGVLFENAYANAPATKQSTASYVTSLYPSTLAMNHVSASLPESTPILMEEMSRGGYRTAVLSANPFISPLLGYGRDVDFFYYRAPRLTSKTALGQAARMLAVRVPVASWPDRSLKTLERVLPKVLGRVEFVGDRADVMHQALLSWIDEDPDASFFAYVHYMETHTPYAAVPPYDTAFGPDDGKPILTDFPQYSRGLLPFRLADPIPERDRQSLIGQYDGAIADLDNQIGSLMEELRRRGLAARTLVVVTADHGDEFYEHGAWGHGHSLHEEVIKVPLIFHYPGSLPQGKRIRALVSHVDLMPTLLGAIESTATESEELEGTNLWPALRSGSAPEREKILFAEYLSGLEYTATLRVRDEKLIFTSYEGKEISAVFDLASDPGELRDLSEERPHVRIDLMSRLLDRRQDLLANRKRVELKVLDDEAREQLRALGYIQ